MVGLLGSFLGFGAGGFCCTGCVCAGVSKPPALVAGLHDVAMVGEAIEQRSGHLGVAKDAGPLREGEVGRDDHAGALVELAEQVEQQYPSGEYRG